MPLSYTALIIIKFTNKPQLLLIFSTTKIKCQPASLLFTLSSSLSQPWPACRVLSQQRAKRLEFASISASVFANLFSPLAYAILCEKNLTRDIQYQSWAVVPCSHALLRRLLRRANCWGFVTTFGFVFLRSFCIWQPQPTFKFTSSVKIFGVAQTVFWARRPLSLEPPGEPMHI
jgi:hypothetical protein